MGWGANRQTGVDVLKVPAVAVAVKLHHGRRQQRAQQRGCVHALWGTLLGRGLWRRGAGGARLGAPLAGAWFRRGQPQQGGIGSRQRRRLPAQRGVGLRLGSPWMSLPAACVNVSCE